MACFYGTMSSRSLDRGGKVVSGLTFCSDDPNLCPANYQFSLQCLGSMKIIEKAAEIGPLKNYRSLKMLIESILHGQVAQKFISNRSGLKHLKP